MLMINNMIQFYEEKELENITKHFNDFTERFEPEAFEIFKDWIQIPSLKDLYGSIRV